MHWAIPISGMDGPGSEECAQGVSANTPLGDVT